MEKKSPRSVCVIAVWNVLYTHTILTNALKGVYIAEKTKSPGMTGKQQKTVLNL